jgi:catechol 2,3-dioxygenase-like lactoylglutathione lyase family enzyme
MSGFTGLDHVIVAVADLDAAARGYARVLGRGPSWRGHHPALGTANALFRLGATCLELLAPAGAHGLAGVLRRRIESEGEGLLGFALGTDDAAACARTLRARGIPAGDPQPGEGCGAGGEATRRWLSVMIPAGATRGILVFAIERLSPPDAVPAAPLEVEEAAAVSGLDHLVVLSEDLEASRRLYGDGFGIRLALDRSFDSFGARLLFFRLGGVTLEIGGKPGPPAGPGPDRLGGLAWRVPDADAARARLDAEGFDVSPVRPGRKSGTRVATLRAGTHGVPTLLIGASAGNAGARSEA